MQSEAASKITDSHSNINLGGGKKHLDSVQSKWILLLGCAVLQRATQYPSSWMRSPSSFAITTLMSWHNLRVMLYLLPFLYQRDADTGKAFLDSQYVPMKIISFHPHLYRGVHLAWKQIWTSESRYKRFWFE